MLYERYMNDIIQDIHSDCIGYKLTEINNLYPFAKIHNVTGSRRTVAIPRYVKTWGHKAIIKVVKATDTGLIMISRTCTGEVSKVWYVFCAYTSMGA